METNLNNLPKFYIGEEVVAIENHSQGKFKAGDKFVIKGIKLRNCKCIGYNVDIGILGNNPFGKCVTCDTYYQKEQSIWWMKQEAFAPIQQQSFPLMTFEKIAESEQKKETEKQLLINN